MMQAALPLKKETNRLGTLFVPIEQFKQYVAQVQFPTAISFGTKTVKCEVAPHPDQKDEYKLSSNLWEELMIPHEGLIHLLQKDDTVFIGPLVGIFTAGFTQFNLRPIGERSLFFAKLLSVEKKVGAFYFVFGAHQIDWDNGTVNGYFYMNDGWKQIEVPIPNVVYDRLPNRKVENLEFSKQVKERLQKEYDIPWFNPGFFNKWDIHQLLVNDNKVNKHLPKSYFQPEFSDINSLIETYKHVYIKPANGSLGLGIQQLIIKDDEPFIYCRFRNNEENRLRRYSTLHRLVRRQFPQGLKGMIAQQGINLLKWNNNPIDFRVHTNKDEHGNWRISAIAAKISGTGSITTHVKSGGEVKTVKEILRDIGANPGITKKIHETALLLSEKIDEKMPGFIGEIGFDIGVDQSEHVWMFEANSKPGRTIFSHPKLKADDLQSRRLPLEYAIYLFKQSVEKQPELVNANGHFLQL
ncbi:MAG: YheC/YheD family protein [Anaerobacillus sp.]|uniref:YheC/YheD family endospore coat-associated protein n=1 Tax=Anaerobacillus sp. TaxID=1872506 RepID=UPI00391A1264